MHHTEAIALANRLHERSVELGALAYGEFTLTAGGTTNYYFDGRLLTTDGEGVEILSALFVDVLMRRDIHHFGGPAVAAVPIIGGVVLAARQKQHDLQGYFVRSEKKSYGMGKLVEGHIQPNDTVALWDDTISTGGSMVSTLDALIDHPAKVDVALCILDRREGGAKRIVDRSVPVFNVFASSSEGRVEVDEAALRQWFE